MRKRLDIKDYGRFDLKYVTEHFVWEGLKSEKPEVRIPHLNV